MENPKYLFDQQYRKYTTSWWEKLLDLIFEEEK